MVLDYNVYLDILSKDYETIESQMAANRGLNG